MRSASLLRVPNALRASKSTAGRHGRRLRRFAPRSSCGNELLVPRLNLARIPERARALRMQVGSAPTLRLAHARGRPNGAESR
ncbi:MAG: hypothetical protein DMF87_03120 [Acidobacteria bacterium]|nr:MAG: hypothetical protein DMF87_03120 [Acidobacteriota bacterium]